MTDEELKKAIDQAAKRGAEQALKNIGLADDEAYQDMRELRMLLDSWRGTKKTIARTFLQFATTAVLSAVLAIIWMQEKSLGG